MISFLDECLAVSGSIEGQSLQKASSGLFHPSIPLECRRRENETKKFGMILTMASQAEALFFSRLAAV